MFPQRILDNKKAGMLRLTVRIWRWVTVGLVLPTAVCILTWPFLLNTFPQVAFSMEQMAEIDGDRGLAMLHTLSRHLQGLTIIASLPTAWACTALFSFSHPRLFGPNFSILPFTLHRRCRTEDTG